MTRPNPLYSFSQMCGNGWGGAQLQVYSEDNVALGQELQIYNKSEAEAQAGCVEGYYCARWRPD